MNKNQIREKFAKELLEVAGILVTDMSNWKITFNFNEDNGFIGYLMVTEEGNIAAGTAEGHYIGVSGLRDCINAINHIERTELIELWEKA